MIKIMKKIFLYAVIFAVCGFIVSCGKDDDNSNVTENENKENQTETTTDNPQSQMPQKTNTMKIFAHYMPWFVSPSASGVWNHWTMSANAVNNQNYASWFHPLTGAYSSDDVDILDYQCLLMKFSGIDGVMVDWYGTQQTNDYPQNEKNTALFLKAVEKAGLKLSIVYEDATLNNLDEDSRQSQARQDMQYLNSNYFKSDSYVKIGENPLLLCFGPQGLTTPKGWNFAFSILSAKPKFIVLNGFSNRANDENYTTSQGEFLWVNPTPDYNSANNFEMYIGGAMPGFYDHYKESGQGNGYTIYDREDGELFVRQLNSAKSANLEYLQISTWNDYGEGTIIEPTEEFEYKYLEILQQFTGVDYDVAALKLVYRWYQIAKKKGSDNENVKKAYNYLNALNIDKAEEIIKTLEQ